MAILMLGLFRTCHNGSFILAKETPVTVLNKKEIPAENEPMAMTPTFSIDKDIVYPPLASSHIKPFV
jgi:hypothetical protein